MPSASQASEKYYLRTFLAKHQRKVTFSNYVWEMPRRPGGGNQLLPGRAKSVSIRPLVFAAGLELAFPGDLSGRKTANEDEQGWVYSSTSAPANHVFTLNAHG